jgi:putative peptidoglycan lipid II flippase
MGMRVVATLIAVAIVVVVAVYGWQLVTGGRTAWQAAPNPDTGAFLTAMPQAPQSAAPLPESVLTIMGARSYDPYGDDDGNGKPDRKKGREGEDQVADAIDQDIATGWLSAAYDTPDLDGKGGVGLILDLGQSRTITGLTMMLNGSGSTAQVRVADEIQKFPEQWTLLEDVPSVPDRIDVRAAQPAKGRYVLLWFPTLGPTAQGTFQVGVQEVEVRGR